MGKLDIIFQRIISDENFASVFDVTPSKYPTIEIGKKAIHPQVRATAEILDELNKKINEQQSNMRVRNISGPVVIDDVEYQAIYRKIVSSLSK